MMSHKDYINISHKYYDGWNDHTEIKSPITGFHKSMLLCSVMLKTKLMNNNKIHKELTFLIIKFNH